MLKIDYDTCLQQLSTLRAAIEVTTKIIFDPTTGRLYTSRDAATILEFTDVSKWHRQNTLDCLYTHLIDSAVLRKVRQQAKGCVRTDRSYAEYFYRCDPKDLSVDGGTPMVNHQVELVQSQYFSSSTDRGVVMKRHPVRVSNSVIDMMLYRKIAQLYPNRYLQAPPPKIYPASTT
jgi:hypothetical protein